MYVCGYVCVCECAFVCDTLNTEGACEKKCLRKVFFVLNKFVFASAFAFAFAFATSRANSFKMGAPAQEPLLSECV